MPEATVMPTGQETEISGRRQSAGWGFIQRRIGIDALFRFMAVPSESPNPVLTVPIQLGRQYVIRNRQRRIQVFSCFEFS